MQIENTISQVTIPARALTVAREESAFDKALDALEIGAGFNYVTGAKDREGRDVMPNTKAQYGRISSKKWAPKGKTFKVFQAENQDGLGELEVRYTVARVDFVEPVKRAKKAASAPAAGGEGSEGGEGHAE